MFYKISVVGGGGRAKPEGETTRQGVQVFPKVLWCLLVFRDSVSVQSIKQCAMLKVCRKCFHRITIQTINRFTHSLRSKS